MKRMYSLGVGTTAAAILMGCSAGDGAEGNEPTGAVESPASVAYRIDAVPSLVSGGTSAASAINDDGVVAGSSQTSSSVIHAIRWAPGSAPKDLGALVSGNASAGAGINRGLTVVGAANVTSVASHAFVYVDPGPMKELPHLDFGGLTPSTQIFAASGINDAGLIVGTSPLQLGAPSFAAYTRAVVWKAGAITDLGSLGGTNSTGSAVNANGSVTGSTSTPTAAEHAFVTTDGGMKDIGVCPGATTSQGRAINAAGDVAGWCFFPQVNGYPDGHPAIRHAFLWTASAGIRDLGSLGNRRGDVLGIGADDTVVGFTVSSTGARVAFIAAAGGAIQDLNTVLPPKSGWVLSEARAINAAGQIAGVGTLNGVAQGFVLTPANVTTTTTAAPAAVPAAPAASAASGPGSLDPTFPATCRQTAPHFSVGSGTHAALQADGKIVTVAAASGADGEAVFGLARFTSAGAADTTFGSGGFVSTPISATGVFTEVGGLAVTGDGKIVVAGSVAVVLTDANGAMSQPDLFVVARYTASGALDTTFGRGGIVTTSIFGKADRARAVLVQGDGKVLVGGEARPNTLGYKGPNITALVRYESNGALDTSFGQGGIVTVTGGTAVLAMALEANGNVFVATPNILRFSASGAPISTAFSGTLTSITPAQFGSVAIAADGKRILGGSVRSPGSKHATFPTVRRVAVDGTVDFTTPGFNYGSSSQSTTAVLQALLVEASGRVIAGGSAVLAAPPAASENGFGLAAIQPSGTVDATFGSATGLSTRISGQDAVGALLQQSDSKIIAVGTCAGGIGLARYAGP